MPSAAYVRVPNDASLVGVANDGTGSPAAVTWCADLPGGAVLAVVAGVPDRTAGTLAPHAITVAVSPEDKATPTTARQALRALRMSTS